MTNILCVLTHKDIGPNDKWTSRFFDKLVWTKFKNWRNGDLACKFNYTNMLTHIQKLHFSCKSFIFATRNNYEHVVQWLFDNGVANNIITICPYIENVSVAAENGNINIIKIIYNHFGKFDYQFYSAVDNASNNGYFNIVKYLVDRGAIGSVDAMDMAAFHGYKSIVQFLHRTNHKSEHALEYALSKGYLGIVTYLYKRNHTFLNFHEAMQTCMERNYINIINMMKKNENSYHFDSSYLMLSVELKDKYAYLSCIKKKFHDTMEKMLKDADKFDENSNMKRKVIKSCQLILSRIFKMDPNIH